MELLDELRESYEKGLKEREERLTKWAKDILPNIIAGCREAAAKGHWFYECSIEQDVYCRVAGLLKEIGLECNQYCFTDPTKNARIGGWALRLAGNEDKING